VEYDYDAFGNVICVNDGRGAIAFRYLGGEIIRSLPNGIKTIFSYSPAGDLKAIRHERADGELISSYSYSHNPAGAITVIDTETPQGHSVTQYEYDRLGRLVSVLLPTGEKITYTFDVLGNRTSETNVLGTISYQYDELGRLISKGDVRYKYDRAGNLAFKEDWKQRIKIEYKYDDEDRLIAIRQGAKHIRYHYDGLGNRVAREEDGKLTHYLNHLIAGMAQVVAEYDASGQIKAHYLCAGVRLGEQAMPGESLYYLEDHLSSIRHVVNEQGELVARYDYSPFGEPSIVSGSGKGKFGYTEEMWDDEAELLYKSESDWIHFCHAAPPQGYTLTRRNLAS
jgi:YD repeat-containing protein